ncbi:MAG: GNAT family N-acetyltransferase [Clostridia bacterium]|nr:GNAT family N-acetyltransferase [Clostridia bacterium]
MIRLAENINELNFLPADPFAGTITALAKTYGFDNTDFVRFYIQDNSAALSIIDGNVTVSADEASDFEEISAFLGAAGYNSVKAGKSVIEKLGLNIHDSSFIVRFIPADYPEPASFTGEYDLREIYNLLDTAGFPTGEFSAFKADICARINHGAAKFGGIAEDGKLLASCFRLFEGEKSILLGAVVTNSEARGRGLASALVPYMADKEKPSFLFCRNDGLLKFYEKSGFEEYGKWAISVKEE